MIRTTWLLSRRCGPVATRTPSFPKQTRKLTHYVVNEKQLSQHPDLFSIQASPNFSLTHPDLVNYRQLESKRNLRDDFLLPKSNYHRSTFPRMFMFRRKKDNKPGKKRIPKLILLQNPLTWLMVKIDFSVLRHVWDPVFQEKEFKFGTKQDYIVTDIAIVMPLENGRNNAPNLAFNYGISKVKFVSLHRYIVSYTVNVLLNGLYQFDERVNAISKVTQVISDGSYSELNGLLTKAARMSLMRELDRSWSDKERSLLALKRDDIQISSPRKVYFIRIADKKFCDVDMAFLALKWTPINSFEALLFTEIFARFHREYTPHCIPEWTIAFFKVTRFEVLRKQ